MVSIKRIKFVFLFCWNKSIMDNYFLACIVHSVMLILELLGEVVQFTREMQMKTQYPKLYLYLILAAVYVAVLFNLYTTWYQGFGMNLISYILLVLILVLDCTAVSHLVGTVPAMICMITGLIVLYFLHEKAKPSFPDNKTVNIQQLKPVQKFRYVNN